VTLHVVAAARRCLRYQGVLQCAAASAAPTRRVIHMNISDQSFISIIGAGTIIHWLSISETGMLAIAFGLSLWLIGTVRAETETVIRRAWVQSPDPAK